MKKPALFQFNPTLAQKRWLVIVTIMLVAILEVLDSTIVNVALPNMMPALGANQEEITWVLTAYVVASAMMIPLTGFLNRRIGHRQLLMVNIIGFMVSSFLCGTAQSLTMMVMFRLFQGGFGAALIPLSQAILRETFPLEEQGKAMAIWGIGIMAAPVLGPTLGGFITQHASWRWVFYINAPICLFSLILTALVIKPTKPGNEKMDWFSVALMFTGIGAMQVVLDQGNTKGWFSSNFILALSIISVLTIVSFIWRNAT
ncbi:MAG: DHA2 family efflux MFS transporter permease subunit, partial [Coxiellaceae bacterium]|nr:DHA2 family efflux MFS transporter permease subunit [Coxiellaceae bacterium]